MAEIFLGNIKGEKGESGVDYIVEQGTSGDWTYRKWKSGVAECWAHITVPLTDCDLPAVADESGYYDASYKLTPLPFQFAVPNEGVQQYIVLNISILHSDAEVFLTSHAFYSPVEDYDENGAPVTNQEVQIGFKSSVGYDDASGLSVTFSVQLIGTWK